MKFRGTLKTYDFAMRETRTTSIANDNRVMQKGETPYLDSIEVSSWGGEGKLPVPEPTKINTDNFSTIAASTVASGTATGLKASDILNPIPGMDWNMDYITARKYVENSPLPYTTFSNFDSTSNPNKTLTVTDLQLSSFWDSAIDASVSFHHDHMSQIELTFKAPPPHRGCDWENVRFDRRSSGKKDG